MVQMINAGPAGNKNFPTFRKEEEEKTPIQIVDEEEQQASAQINSVGRSSPKGQPTIGVVPFISELSQHMESENHEEKMQSPFVLLA